MDKLVCKTQWHEIYIINGRNIIKNSCIGLLTAEQVRENRNMIKEIVSFNFNGQPWGFIPILTRLATITDPEVSKEFTAFHNEFLKLGCRAFAFITAKTSIAVKVQSQRHQDISGANELLINYFTDEQKALEWLKEIGI
jgi:hypothetical protein